MVEPWLAPEQIRAGHVGLVTAESDSVKVARMTALRVHGRQCLMEFQYLIGRSGAVEHRSEQHHTWLWTRDEYARAFAAAGLEAVHDEEGLMGRGLWIATAP